MVGLKKEHYRDDKGKWTDEPSLSALSILFHINIILTKSNIKQ